MKISDYLKDEQIILDLASTDKRDAIRELAATLEGNPMVESIDRFLEETYEREDFNTTGIGHEIAIPHARSEAVTDIVIAFGRSAPGLGFDSLDGKPVKLIFLIGTPKRNRLSTYLSVLARLTRLLEKASFREELVRAGSTAEIRQAFETIED